jgi:16S rRNA (cytidine1402-2'-O)-methyltransferase
VPADHFVFEGFLPVKPGRRLNRLRALRELETTIVCYESPHRIAGSLAAIAEVFGETSIVLARELTKQFEEIVEGTPGALAERFAGAAARGEFTLVIPYTKRPCVSPGP